MYWERARKAMIRPDHPRLSIARQCRLVSIGRSSYYHEARGESAENLALMALDDCQFLETPFYGARQMPWHLRAAGHLVNVHIGRGAVGETVGKLECISCGAGTIKKKKK